jgi:hypothetical protein
MSRDEAMNLAKLLKAQYGGQESFRVSLGDHASFDLVQSAFLELGCGAEVDREGLMLTVFPGPATT